MADLDRHERNKRPFVLLKIEKGWTALKEILIIANQGWVVQNSVSTIEALNLSWR
jgi:hypothetical protein